MKDSLGPLKALAVASVVNGFGDILLCCVFNFGIAGAAWATMVSQVCPYLFINFLLTFKHMNLIPNLNSGFLLYTLLR